MENVRIGETGEVFLLNREGIFQTSPRFSGRIMEKSPLSMEKVRDNNISIDLMDPKRGDSGPGSPPQVVARTWLREPRWMLVVRQDYTEAFDEVNHANYATLIFLHLSALTILIVAVFITKYMIKVIRKRDQAAGLDEDFKGQLKSSLSQIDSQVYRCKRITQNLLRFSRRTRSMIETVDINSFLKEVAELMEREARSNGIQIIVEPDENLPAVLSDPSQLQQVFLNLITNAIDAHDGRPYGTIRIRTMTEDKEEGFEILFSDTGTGIAPENLERIFDPFFTTKPVGKGTGLGLSICYSIIKNLGGEIEVRSELGKGAEFRIFLPYRPPAHALESMEEKEDLA